jgi:hypothetical protein
VIATISGRTPGVVVDVVDVDVVGAVEVTAPVPGKVPPVVGAAVWPSVLLLHEARLAAIVAHRAKVSSRLVIGRS